MGEKTGQAWDIAYAAVEAYTRELVAHHGPNGTVTTSSTLAGLFSHIDTGRLRDIAMDEKSQRMAEGRPADCHHRTVFHQLAIRLDEKKAELYTRLAALSATRATRGN